MDITKIILTQKEILNEYIGSLITLNQYDDDRIENQKGSESIKIEIDELREFINKTKNDLITNGEATDLFGQEYEGKFEGTIAAVYEAFGGNDVYPTAEEKAANLLYLIIKNRGFVDGNKRIGSILFIYFLSQNKILQNSKGEFKITENTLVALALLIAQSNPNDKAVLIKLVIKLLED
jgi:prophage maintenance system killer protein